MAAEVGAPPRIRGTRIQRQKRQMILDAALEVFARHGFRGATLDQIASEAGLSKPNLLYYFDSKEAIHQRLLSDLLDAWLAPLRAIDPAGDPVREICAYVLRKLEMAREYPRESRLFANEILHGAPHLADFIRTDLRRDVEAAARLIVGWAAAGRIAAVDPHHLIFSIWATTQHYADFEAQARMIRGPGIDPAEGAAAFLETLYKRLLTPPQG